MLMHNLKWTRLTTLVCLALLTPRGGAAEPDPALRLWLPLDEGADTLATDRSPSGLEAELTNVRWAKGAFGTAAYFGGTGAFIELPPVPSLSGAKQCTISLWTTWEGAGRYPNLLTTRTWSPGGYLSLAQAPNGVIYLFGSKLRGAAFNVAWLKEGTPLK